MADWKERVAWSVSQIEKLSRGPTRGCSAPELSSFQLSAGVELPQAYLLFLQQLGHSAGDLMHGTDFSFGKLGDLQDSALDLLEDDQAPPLPANAFVFCGHEDYQFLFFVLEGNPDPAVFRYMEGEGIQMVASSFSEWLRRTVIEEFPGAVEAS